ncbi:harmonin-like isoform X7 [Pomacea canaliculata]|uniref:harmonin-like isoform X7 n=1 Tax=Pomacea canaliculata TaxID=400727 RepID=UPI000D7310A9|nr:harmonin-like isoform X7 [Pomacea canaliculata]
MMLLATWSCESGVPSKEYFTMERKFARYFHLMAQDLIPDDGYRAQLFGALSSYQSSQDVHRLLSDLRQVLDVPEKLELYEYIRPLVLLQHQMEYSYRAPSAPGVRLRTIRLRHLPGQSIGFALRGGFEFGVGMFVSVVEAGSQAELRGLRAGDELVRVNGFVIAEAIHEDVLNLIKSREEIVLKVTHIGMIPIKEKATDPVTWRYADDLDSKPPLEEVLKNTTRRKGRPLELKIFVDASGYSSIGCGILSGPRNFPGIFVEKVRPGSLAHEAGLDVGDQIVEVNDTNFLNISHNEAVMVLKSSKQLNLIIRKKVGMVLFENRQKQSPSHSLNSTQSGQSQPVMQSRLPSSYTSPSKNLDESSLIEDQLRRGLDGLGKATSISASQQNGIETETTSFSYTKVSSDTGHTNGTIPADEFTSSDIDGKELRSFEFPKGQDLKIAMEGGNGTPLAGKIVVSAVFDGGAAIENGLQTGDQLLMVNGKKLTDVTLAEAEKILEEAKMGSQKMVRVVYAQSLFLNNEECVTYF